MEIIKEFNKKYQIWGDILRELIENEEFATSSVDYLTTNRNNAEFILKIMEDGEVDIPSFLLFLKKEREDNKWSFDGINNGMIDKVNLSKLLEELMKQKIRNSHSSPTFILPLNLTEWISDEFLPFIEWENNNGNIEEKTDQWLSYLFGKSVFITNKLTITPPAPEVMLEVYKRKTNKEKELILHRRFFSDLYEEFKKIAISKINKIKFNIGDLYFYYHSYPDTRKNIKDFLSLLRENKIEFVPSNAMDLPFEWFMFFIKIQRHADLFNALMDISQEIVLDEEKQKQIKDLYPVLKKIGEEMGLRFSDKFLDKLLFSSHSEKEFISNVLLEFPMLSSEKYLISSHYNMRGYTFMIEDLSSLESLFEDKNKINQIIPLFVESKINNPLLLFVFYKYIKNKKIKDRILQSIRHNDTFLDDLMKLTPEFIVKFIVSLHNCSDIDKEIKKEIFTAITLYMIWFPTKSSINLFDEEYFNYINFFTSMYNSDFIKNIYRVLSNYGIPIPYYAIGETEELEI